MPPVVRFAPSPTGFLHIGGVRTASSTGSIARQQGGEFRLRIENTDTSREVAEATDQIQESLRWLGLDWDGDGHVPARPHGATAARRRERLVAEGKAYEDEGAIRFRHARRGRHRLGRRCPRADRVPEREARRPRHRPLRRPADLQLRLAGRGLARRDHARHPRRRPRLEHAEADPHPRGRSAPTLPVYAHVPNIHGEDGKKLSKRHGAVSVEEFRAEGYLPEALVNFLALLGWSYDDKTTIMSRDELVERFSLERVGREPGDLRLQEARLAERHRTCARSRRTNTPTGSSRYLREQGYDWDEELVRALGPARPGEDRDARRVPGLRRLPLRGRRARRRRCSTETCWPRRSARSKLRSRSRAEAIEQALRAVAEQLELKPREAFQPIRVAVTGSKISPGLFESIELLGRERSLERIRQRPGGSGLGAASGSRAR